MSEQLMRALAKSKSKKNKVRSNGRLVVFNNGDSVKIAQKLYFGFISQTDLGGFPLFLLRLDQMMLKERKICRDPVNLNPQEDENSNEEEEAEDDENMSASEKARRYRSSMKRDRNDADEDEDDDDVDDSSEEIRIPKAAKKMAKQLIESGFDQVLSNSIRSSRSLNISDIKAASPVMVSFIKRLVANGFGSRVKGESVLYGKLDPLTISLSAPEGNSAVDLLKKLSTTTSGGKFSIAKDPQSKVVRVGMMQTKEGVLYVAEKPSAGSKRNIAHISLVTSESDAHVLSISDINFHKPTLLKFAKSCGIDMGGPETASLSDYEQHNQMGPRRNRAFQSKALPEGLGAFFKYAMRFIGSEVTVGRFSDTENGPAFTPYPNVTLSKAVVSTNPMELAFISSVNESNVLRILAKFVSQNKGWRLESSRVRSSSGNNSYKTYGLIGPNSCLIVLTWKASDGAAFRIVEIDDTTNPVLLRKRIDGFNLQYFKKLLNRLDPSDNGSKSSNKDSGDLYDDDEDYGDEEDGDDSDVDADDTDSELYDGSDDDVTDEADEDDDENFDEDDDSSLPAGDDEEDDDDAGDEDDQLTDETGEDDLESAAKFAETVKIEGVVVAIDPAFKNSVVLKSMGPKTSIKTFTKQVLVGLESVVGKMTAYQAANPASTVRMVFGKKMVDFHLARKDTATLEFFQGYKEEETESLVDDLRSDGVEIDDSELDEQPSDKAVARMMKEVASGVSSMRPFLET